MGQRISYILLAIQLAMLRWNMTTDYEDVEGGVRLVSCAMVVLAKGKGHRESHAGFFYFLSCWLSGGSSLGGAAPKLLIFLHLLYFHSGGILYPCFSLATDPVGNNIFNSF